MPELDEELDESKSPSTDKELLEEARERLQHCIETHETSRKKQLFDLKFATLDQWDDGIRSQREDPNQPGGPRPCLTIDKINQYISQVVNDMRQNQPSVKARPMDSDADLETAKVFQDYIRHIEEQSLASVAYITAGQSQVITGEGYCRVVTEWEEGKTWKQRICIKPIPDMFTVHLGPHVMPDGSDATYGFIIDEMPKEKFKREFPGKKCTTADFADLSEAQRYWESHDSVWVAEYFYFDYTASTIHLLADGNVVSKEDYDSIPEALKPEIVKTRPATEHTVKWCKLTGVEVLEKKDWAGKFVPIAKAIGKESWVDGKHVVWGIVRPAMDSLRAYNYWFSAITEKMALAPKAPFIGAVGQFETNGDKWDKANNVPYSRLEYDAIEVNGAIVPAPQRQQPTAMEAALVHQLQLIEHDIQTSLGMFKASLGQEQPQQSGKAILALTRESDTGSFHFPDNLALMVRYVGRILVDLIPKVIDTRQILRLLGEDGEHKSAQIDPSQQEAYRQVPTADGGVKKIFNLDVGEYDVVSATGPSFNTRRMEAASTFTDLANTAKDPTSAAVMRYLAIKNADFNGVEKAVEMLKKLLPPQLQELDGDQPPVSPAVEAKMQQMGQQMQQMQALVQKMHEHVTELESGAAQAQAKVASDHNVKMQQLKLKAEEVAEELRIAEEKVKAELALETYAVEERLKLQHVDMGHEHALAGHDQAFQQLMAKMEHVQKTLDGFEVQGAAKN